MPRLIHFFCLTGIRHNTGKITLFDNLSRLSLIFFAKFSVLIFLCGYNSAVIRITVLHCGLILNCSTVGFLVYLFFTLSNSRVKDNCRCPSNFLQIHFRIEILLLRFWSSFFKLFPWPLVSSKLNLIKDELFFYLSFLLQL